MTYERDALQMQAVRIVQLEAAEQLRTKEAIDAQRLAANRGRRIVQLDSQIDELRSAIDAAAANAAVVDDEYEQLRKTVGKLAPGDTVESLYLECNDRGQRISRLESDVKRVEAERDALIERLQQQAGVGP